MILRKKFIHKKLEIETPWGTDVTTLFVCIKSLPPRFTQYVTPIVVTFITTTSVTDRVVIFIISPARYEI